MAKNIEVDILNDEMLTKTELSSILKISTSTIGELMRETNIPRYHLGRRVLFRRSEVLEWMKRYRSTGQKSRATRKGK